MDQSIYINWAEVNLSKLQNNIKRIQEIIKRPMMAVVKANAYGHGLVEIAQAAREIGIDWFGVARLEEALQLRKAGINGNILVFGYTNPEAVPLAQSERLHLSVYDRSIVQQYAAKASQRDDALLVHLKIDSGMGRLGIFPEEGLEFMRWLKEAPGLKVAGIFTHFARADEPQEPATLDQIKRFDRLVTILENASLRPPLVHASNSGATLAFPEAKYDLLRPGILMYGLSPSSQVTLPEGISPILEWKTRLTSIKTLPAGHGISYGHEYVTRGKEKVGALAVGYADGYRRTSGNWVLSGGQRVPVVGRVCMDQTMVKLNERTNSRIGAEVVLLGSQGDETICAEEIANRWGTINYEVVAGIASRVNRIYIR